MNVYSLLKLVFLISVLCSCGQMGPLYLPGTPPPIHVEKEKTAQPADEQKTDSPSPTSPQNK
jgi:predicted small lipoprotein YifL